MNQFENANKMHSKRRRYGLVLGTTLYYIVVVVILIFFLSNPRVSIPFSDGFESGDSSAWNDGINTGGTGSVSFVQSPVYNGSWASKCQVTKASPNTDWAETIDTFGDTYVTVYFRAYVQVTTLPASGEAFDLLEFLDAYDYNTHVLVTLGLGHDGGAPKWQLYYLKGGGYSTLYAGTPTANEWHCLELIITVDASNGTVKGYVDGVLLLSDSGFKNNDYGNARDAVLGLDTWLGEGYPNVGYFDCAIISGSKR
jgi:hypothetical protein